jgi:hypothetical protein
MGSMQTEMSALNAVSVAVKQKAPALEAGVAIVVGASRLEAVFNQDAGPDVPDVFTALQRISLMTIFTSFYMMVGVICSTLEAWRRCEGDVRRRDLNMMLDLEMTDSAIEALAFSLALDALYFTVRYVRAMNDVVGKTWLGLIDPAELLRVLEYRWSLGLMTVNYFIWPVWVMAVGWFRHKARYRLHDATVLLLIADTVPGYLMLFGFALKFAHEIVRTGAEGEQNVVGAEKSRTVGPVTSRTLDSMARALNNGRWSGSVLYTSCGRHLGWWGAAIIVSALGTDVYYDGWNSEKYGDPSVGVAIEKGLGITAITLVTILTLGATMAPEAVKDIGRLRVRLVDISNPYATTWGLERRAQILMATLRYRSVRVRAWANGSACFARSPVNSEWSRAVASVRGAVLQRIDPVDFSTIRVKDEIQGYAHVVDTDGRAATVADVIAGTGKLDAPSGVYQKRGVLARSTVHN